MNLFVEEVGEKQDDVKLTPQPSHCESANHYTTAQEVRTSEPASSVSQGTFIWTKNTNGRVQTSHESIHLRLHVFHKVHRRHGRSLCTALLPVSSSPGVGVVLQVLPQVPEEVLLRQEQRRAQRQQLPALQGDTRELAAGRRVRSGLGGAAHLRKRMVVRRPAVGLLDQLAIHLVLQLRVGQAHLQGALGQRGVVVHRRRLHQDVDEELTRLQAETRDATAAQRPAGGAQEDAALR